MLDHIEIATHRMAECVHFYQGVLGPCGYHLSVDGKAKAFQQGTRTDFWIVDGNPSQDVHFAFEASTRDAVVDAYERIVRSGGTLDRAPALAPNIHENYFAGYGRDPDGRLVEFVCQTPPLEDRQ
jgi:catechol 2,3-dioxygenase-like lactoylglutathione lyase family enzyme